MTSSRGPLPDALRPLTWCAARIYGLGASMAAASAERTSPHKLDVPVISIGNITAGGTGKTPFTTCLVRSLLAAGARPGIALRGYRAEATGGSDEAEEYAGLLPDTPVIVGSDRAASVRRYMAGGDSPIDLVLMDDGFQHRSLHRDLDIVLIDATRPGIDGDLLPNGWLREPPRALERADIVVLTHAGGDDAEVEDLVRKARGSLPEVACRHAWDSIDVYERGACTGSIEHRPDATAITLASGIGNPATLESQVREEGFEVIEHLIHRDHAAYDEAISRRIASSARTSGGLLVTRKDWVKLRASEAIGSLDVPVFVPNVRIEILRGAGDLAAALQESCGHAVSL